MNLDNSARLLTLVRDYAALREGELVGLAIEQSFVYWRAIFRRLGIFY
jgi:hypothetical protein